MGRRRLCCVVFWYACPPLSERPIFITRSPHIPARSLHEPDLLALAHQTRGGLRELSIAKCDSLGNAALVRLCLLCPLEALNVADCLRLDAGFIHALAAAAAAAAATVTKDDTTPPAAAAAAAANEPPMARPAPLASLHSLNARQCRGWTDATTALLLSPQGCGARSLRRLYLGGTAASALAASASAAASAAAGGARDSEAAELLEEGGGGEFIEFKDGPFVSACLLLIR